MKSKKLLFILAFVSILLFAYVYKYRFSLQMMLPLQLPDITLKNKTFPYMASFGEKVWLHRVNSIPRIQAMARKYKGMEVDVNFDTLKHSFDVHHISVPSQNITLENLLGSIDKVEERYFWLDFKNLNSNNQDQALAHLNDLCSKYKIQNSVIVESLDPQLLTAFTDKGYYTSYYLPEFNPYDLNKKEIERMVQKVDEKLSGARVNGLSGNSILFPFISKYFPESDILVWNLSTEKLNIFPRLIQMKLEKEAKIKVILIHEYSEGYY